MKTFPRRTFVGASLATAAALSLDNPLLAAAGKSSSSPRPNASQTIDVNVHLSRWPFRRLPLDETPALVAHLRNLNVAQAWAGSFDGLLHKDLAAVNQRLATDCRQFGEGLLIPFGSINPTLPDWEEDVRRCHEVHRMPGIRLHPGYHGYTLSDPQFARLLALAAARGLIVQLAASMEDDRTHHPLLRVPHVDLQPLIPLLKTLPQLRVVLLNWPRSARGQTLLQLVAAGKTYFDTSFVEGVNGVAELAKQVPLDRLLMGSHAPFFVPEAAGLKLKESLLTASQEQALRAGNARQLLGTI